MIDEISDDQLRNLALDALTERLGPARTLRFLSWLRNKPRDYQTWRDTHFGGMTADDLIARMRAEEAKSG